MKKIIYTILSFIVVTMLLFACAPSKEAEVKTDWTKDYEKYLNENFVDDETGIVNFKIDTSLIYVTINPNIVPRNEYQSMANAWARNFSEEKQKHTGSSVTSYIVVNDKIVAEINYNKKKGFHK